MVIFVSRDDMRPQLAKIELKNLPCKLYNYRYRHFIIELPRHILSSRHEIVGDAELELLRKNHVELAVGSCKLIFDDDPQCIWIGGMPGDVIRITRLSNNTGESIDYRYVVRRGAANLPAAPIESVEDPEAA